MNIDLEAVISRDTCNTLLAADVRKHARPSLLRETLTLLTMAAIFILIPAIVFSSPRDKYVVTSWTTDSGLPQNSVTSILQAKNGYIWIGTFGGLVRYNGNDFRVFTPANTPGLRGLRVNCIFEDSGGNLWVATADGGLSALSESGFKNYAIREGLPSNYVTSVCEGKDGAIWAGTDKGIARYREGRWESFAKDEGLRDSYINTVSVLRDGSVLAGTASGAFSLTRGRWTAIWRNPRGNGSDSAVNSFLEDPARKGIWIGTGSSGLVFFKENKFEYFTFDPVEKPRQSPPNIWTICPYSGSELLLGCFNGFYLFDGRNFFAAPESRRVLRDSEEFVRSIYKDGKGNIWVGTNGGGLHRLKKPRIESFGVVEGLPGDSVVPVTVEPDGSVLVGVTSAGLARIRDGKITPEPAGSRGSPDAVWTLCRASDGALWIGTWGGGLIRLKGSERRVYNKDNGLPSNVVLALYEDSMGGIWVGTNKGFAVFRDARFSVYDKGSGLVDDTVLYFKRDGSGTMWIGTLGGISRLKDGVFSNITEKDGLSCGHVRCIHEDEDGTFWFATYGGGLARYKDGKISNVTVSDGLINDALSMILEDDRDDLWISSNKGIMRINRHEINSFLDGRSKAFTTSFFGEPDGMASSECNGGGQPAGCRTADGRLWFPTMKGVVAVDPYMKSLPAPGVLIEEIILDRTLSRSPSMDDRIGPGIHQLEIHYSAMAPEGSDRTRYRFRLIGYDTDWVEAGGRRVAYYTNLQPGTYTFEVFASSSDGVWSDEKASVRFHVRPYFYQTWFFYMFCFLAGIGCVAAYVRHRTGMLKRKAQELERTVSERTAELEEQGQALAIVNDELTRSHGDLQEILEHLRTGVAIVGSDGRVEFLNNTTHMFLGVEKDSITGMDWREIFPLTEDSANKLSVHMRGDQETNATINAAMELPDGKLFLTEIEVVSHPRLRNQKILYFHEMTEAYRLKDTREIGDRAQMMIGQSPAILKIYRSIEALGKVDTTVLIRGETGSGKEVIARAIHQASRRKEQPFIAINCAGLTETVLASQLFGHKKGSFTGAIADQIGLIEAASGGTLLLDEIGDMSLEVQRTLLRVLQEKEIVRLGETSARRVDLRFIAATHRDLEKQVIEGSFRQDLLYRIKIAEIIVPPLRERVDDIPLLANSFLQEFKDPDGVICGFSREAMDAMVTYGWPGNVRELRSAVESAVVRSGGVLIMPEDIPISITDNTYRETTQEAGEQERLKKALKQTKGNIIKAAQKLGVTRMTIYRWISKFNIDIDRYR